MKMILPLALVISLVFVGTSATISLELGTFPKLSKLGEVPIDPSINGETYNYTIGNYTDLDTVHSVIEKLEDYGFNESFLVEVQNK